jgi:hypothetical protein
MSVHGPVRSACPGCGLVVDEFDGPTHPYIGASAACWAVYGEVLALEYGEFAYPEIHRLTVDAYATQHPGVESRRSTQSVAIHLIAMHLWIEREMGAQEILHAIRASLARNPGFEWLTPPSFEGSLTIADVRGTGTLGEHIARVEAWGRSVWDAWKEHHAVVRQWAGSQPER